MTEEILQATFVPFGDVVGVRLPLDHATGKHRGFAFVEMEDEDDAAAAVENLDDAELFGRVLRVNVARPAQMKSGASGGSAKDAEDWFKTKLKEGGEDEDGEEDDLAAATRARTREAKKKEGGEDEDEDRLVCCTTETTHRINGYN